MVQKPTVKWIERGLRGLVIGAAVAVAIAVTTGPVRYLAVVVAVLVFVRWLMPSGHKEWDERELFVNYVASALAYMTTFIAILVAGFIEFWTTSTISPTVGLLTGIAGFSHFIFSTYMKRT